MRPDRSEYDDFYAGYVGEVADGPILDTLERQGEETRRLLAGVDEARGGYRYAPGKWTLRQVVGHMVDAERVFAARALWFARGDAQPLPGFEQDDWAAASGADRRPLAELAAEAASVRHATLALFAGLDDGELARRGVASGCTFSVRALAWIIAGHERHHLEVLRQRYLGA